MKKIWVLVSIAVIAIIVFMLFLYPPKPQKTEVKVGWVGPLTGDYAYFGDMMKTSTEIAVDEINEKWSSTGRQMKVIYEDDEMDPKKGTMVFHRLITTDNVPVAIQSAGSSVMLANAPIAEKNKVVLISPTCSNDKIKFAGDYVFRNWPSDNFQGQVIADFAYKELEDRKAAILYINNDYGAGLKDVFVKKFSELGGKVVGEEAFSPGETDYRTSILKVTKGNPDIIFLPSSYKEAALVVRQARESGVKTQFISGDGCFSEDFIKLAEGAAEGTIVTNMKWNPNSDNKIVQSFVKKFKEKAGKDPDAYAASAYDCVKLIALAIEREGSNSEGIKKGLYSIKDFHGVTGITAFDKYGEVE
jgi:branched-chain amino acid transport system substrate-binding protein